MASSESEVTSQSESKPNTKTPVKKNTKFEITKALQADAADIIAAVNKAKIIYGTRRNIKAAGEEVERAVRKTLERKLPANCQVGQGHIVDSKWDASSQLDIVITNNSVAPSLLQAADGTQYFPYESVFAVGEVKTSYKKSDKPVHEFVDTITHIKSTLKRHPSFPDFKILIEIFNKAKHAGVIKEGSEIETLYNFAAKVAILPDFDAFNKTYLEEKNAGLVKEGNELDNFYKEAWEYIYSYQFLPERNPLFSFMIFTNSNRFKFGDIEELYKENSEHLENLPNVICFLDKGVIFNAHLERNEKREINLSSPNHLNPNVYPKGNPPHRGYTNNWVFTQFETEDYREGANLGFLSSMLISHINRSKLDRPNSLAYLQNIFHFDNGKIEYFADAEDEEEIGRRKEKQI